MKINFSVRLKNPVFWVGLAGVVLSSMGASADMFQSWEAVRTAVMELLSNPYRLGCVIFAIVGVFVDPTTSGISDSSRAMTYKAPSKE